MAADSSTKANSPRRAEPSSRADASTRTVERALSLLGVVCEQSDIALSEAANLVNLSPSTALRLLRTLEQTGFVRRDDRGLYSPGSRVIQFGALAVSQDSLITLCSERMHEIAEVTGESTYLSIRSIEESGVYIAIAEGTHSVRHTSWVGRSIPLRESAAGQALLGKGPPAGYVIAEQGVENDVTAIAAPIYSGTKIVAALSVVAPSYRMDDTKDHRIGTLLVDTASTIFPPMTGNRNSEHIS
ncbi:IclR family transcriptional regulator [Lysinibacter cavernae]|uniref:DNA-binding IclR family transcriptional regulator n=1 Tax=Lysinibacter cavernae TaxID=1640652 RepID=A0A7X5R067_9MICO|nr:IclR family transcriptional regulator [Lysinibacter cavernae]NIH53206.1 DNA-binding IclR family transcriptional regulator [Lysinibacter cavernae]